MYLYTPMIALLLHLVKQYLKQLQENNPLSRVI